ncbi:hypothetical protein [uncultured Tateyamaria sp.]|uniref:hypothetical protein n=1 Tax=uncultured Tateyamaria sp. TaxID=455651 RepID=UPI0026390C02|nr:hypothetical protein [uncultured Tateyamaria sp.]
MTDKSWTEIQALAVKAATGAEVPPAQALAFGSMLARHLADGGSEAPLSQALDTPATILALAHQVERMIETASVSGRVVGMREQDPGRRAMLISWLASLPCQAEITANADEVCATLSLSAPGLRARPARISIGSALFEQMQTLAARTYVPDSDASRAGGAGAGLMDLD